MATIKPKKDNFYRQYNLTEARKNRSSKTPAIHQSEALNRLNTLHQIWSENSSTTAAGGLLVLPTGGGKTFTAVRFLCTGPLSQGYKVLWLAHTHHLLEQAFYNFGPDDATSSNKDGSEVGWIAEPKQDLTVRVVSGTPGHFRIHQIKPSDDVLICTIQSATYAHKNEHPKLRKFLEEANGKLMVVFDEAHHAPAPSYRRLITQLRQNYPGTCLLGLTATPTYSDEKKRGWLKTLFPQGIIHQVTPQELMAQSILAQPVLEDIQTDFDPTFNERDYQKWVGTYRDIPENIITDLAQNRDRNTFIADTYVKNRARYGKTVIFADRWYQCDQLRELLRARNVRADVIYSHVDADPGSAEARNRRHKDENAQVLDAFRRDELDVLINVRMLTEGTDVPDVQTIFLTRQTTSAILLTQMIGRALRGPKFGGTEQAYIVSFIDNWKHLINWAEYDQLTGVPDDQPERDYGKRPPLQLISIDLVRRLVRQIGSGSNINPTQFLSLMPSGWYRVEFSTKVADSDDYESVQQLLMVFDNEKAGYEAFIRFLEKADIEPFMEEDVKIEDHHKTLVQWRKRFFTEIHFEANLLTHLFHIARHMTQNDRTPPEFFSFAERDDHDLDAVAQKFINDDLGRRAEDQALQTEYHRPDRYWKTIYPDYGLFKSQYDACVNRLLEIGHSIGHSGKGPQTPIFNTPETPADREPSEAVKEQVKVRDNHRCLCCGNTYRLEIDHIAPSYLSGDNSLGNLQTLCSICNKDKGINKCNFRAHQKDQKEVPSIFPELKLPLTGQVQNTEKWEQFIRRTVNLFYQCAAVESVKIGKRGAYFYQWEIRLYAGNDPAWLKPHLKGLVKRIRKTRENVGLKALTGITVVAPGQPPVRYSTKKVL